MTDFVDYSGKPVRRGDYVQGGKYLGTCRVAALWDTMLVLVNVCTGERWEFPGKGSPQDVLGQMDWVSPPDTREATVGEYMGYPRRYLIGTVFQFRRARGTVVYDQIDATRGRGSVLATPDWPRFDSAPVYLKPEQKIVLTAIKPTDLHWTNDPVPFAGGGTDA